MGCGINDCAPSYHSTVVWCSQALAYLVSIVKSDEMSSYCFKSKSIFSSTDITKTSILHHRMELNRTVLVGSACFAVVCSVQGVIFIEI